MSPSEIETIINNIEDEFDLVFWDSSRKTMPHCGAGCIDDGTLFRFEAKENIVLLTIGHDYGEQEEYPICESFSALVGSHCKDLSDWVDLFRTLLYALDDKNKNMNAYTSVQQLLKG